jgi:hypothetical protein
MLGRMTIGEFLSVRTSEKEFPATNALQKRISDALREDKGDKAERLAAALAFAILDLEVALVNANAERLKLKAYVLELEARILNADIELDDPRHEL